ncbi:hypothetical protein SAMN04487947_0066 [Halogeometricum rufum]|uniref:Uncharacterized protein n=1 Tax=Halogeometricum rufum TaxID=553469 RepID=A0A1I6FVB3_9EURY|nr:hypothetical protein [Halogeometricum rufum]SFR33826.1 hypothetical protein SAMN04487947_0066 [Halogeometricum rufum]
MRRAGILLVAAGIVVLTAIPTGSLSATQADRGVTGTVASDASAYVGVEMRLERERPSPGNASVRANGSRPAANGTRVASDVRNGTPAANGAVGRSGESLPAAAPTARTLFVTVTNRVPDLGGFVAVVSVEGTRDGDVRTVSDRVVVDDEATATLTPVACDDRVRVVVQSEDVRIAFTRPVPCEA